MTPGGPGRSGPVPRPLLLGLGWDRPGGLNRYLRDLRAALEKQGVPTSTVVLGPGTDAPDSVKVAAAENSPLPLRLVQFALAARRLAASSDVVDAHFALFAWWPVRWGSLRKHPLVVHFHGPWSQESRVAGQPPGSIVKAKHRLERSVYSRADRLIVLSEAFASLVVRDFGVAPWKVRVVRPGVDLERFAPDRDGARQRLGHGEDRIVFTARRLVPRMGLEVLLDAWSQLDLPGHRLMIAGEGPARDVLEAQVRRLGLAGSVRLLGRLDEADLVDHYRSADLCVLPSVALEGFGLAAVEALACGTPVVVTDVGGLPEVVEGLDPSLVVPSGDAAALAGRIASALAGQAPTPARCRQHAETFSWSRAASEHLNLYDEAVEERSGTRQRRRLRVVYLDHCAQLSGAEIALARLIEALPDVDAHVVLGEDGPLHDRLRAAGATVELLSLPVAAGELRRDAVRPSRLPLRSAVDTALHVLRLARRLRQLQPDVVHTNSLKSALYGSAAGRLAGVPVVWHARDRVAADYLPSPAVRLVRAAARRLPSMVLANSRATLDTLRLPAKPRDRAVVIGDPYRPPVPVSAPQRRGLTVGMVGRLAPWKGQHVFLEAFARTRPREDVRAVIVGSAMFGEDAYEAELIDLVDRCGLAGRVAFLGYRDDVPAELARLDICVHASLIPEPFGQVVVEAMATGLPVVASAAGGPAEIINDGVDGLLYQTGDVDALAAVLDRLLDDASLRARLGERAMARATDFGPTVIGPQVMDCYRKVLA